MRQWKKRGRDRVRRDGESRMSGEIEGDSVKIERRGGDSEERGVGETARREGETE